MPQMNNSAIKGHLADISKRLRDNARAARSRPVNERFHEGRATAYDHSSAELESLIDLLEQDSSSSSESTAQSMSANSTQEPLTR